MAMFQDDPVRPEPYQRFEHEVPSWFTGAKLGIFVHWGAYSVPAWAEPIGPLGGTGDQPWFAHNPYAEWYYNTIRIPGSPAAEHHKEVYGDAPYDDLLDLWDARDFNADEFLALVKSTGARYFVHTTKHHDGITLWDAPGTNGRNTVARGPKRDLTGEFEKASRKAGVKFGVYYSGGLDWHFDQSPPIVDGPDGWNQPEDAAYAEYAYKHVEDLISKYRPDVLWGDISWPDAGLEPGPFSMANLFEQFYTATPDGVSNDRWGLSHWDYRTSEYENGTAVEAGKTPWENCRGVGFSFGHNKVEDASHMLSGPDAVRMLVDIASRGGNFLLNVGLSAEGTVPELQRVTLEHLAAWNGAYGEALFDSHPLESSVAAASNEPWVRWTTKDGKAYAFINAAGEVRIPGVSAAIAAESAALLDGTAVSATHDGDALVLQVPAASVEGPVVVGFALNS